MTDGDCVSVCERSVLVHKIVFAQKKGKIKYDLILVFSIIHELPFCHLGAALFVFSYHRCNCYI